MHTSPPRNRCIFLKTHTLRQSFGQIELLNGSTAAFSAVTRGVTRLIILDAEFLPKDALSQAWFNLAHLSASGAEADTPCNAELRVLRVMVSARDHAGLASLSHRAVGIVCAQVSKRSILIRHNVFKVNSHTISSTNSVY